MTTSSEGTTERREVEFFLPGDPVPAARPRIRVIKTKSGKSIGNAYYTGAYKRYTVEAPKAIPESPIFFDKGTALKVTVIFNIRRPGKPANPYPVGDIDNYIKSILDAITKNGTYWHDDTQVETIKAGKRYVQLEDAIGTSVLITES